MKILHLLFGETVYFKNKYFEFESPFGGCFLLFLIYFVMGIFILIRGIGIVLHGAGMMIATASFFVLLAFLVMQVYRLFSGNW
jgi:hypothetical protein